MRSKTVRRLILPLLIGHGPRWPRAHTTLANNGEHKGLSPNAGDYRLVQVSGECDSQNVDMEFTQSTRLNKSESKFFILLWNLEVGCGSRI